MAQTNPVHFRKCLVAASGPTFNPDLHSDFSKLPGDFPGLSGDLKNNYDLVAGQYPAALQDRVKQGAAS